MRNALHLLACLPLALAACGGDGGETLRLGGLFATTGPSAAKGFAQLSAARLAVAQINEAGGVRGKRLVLTYRDDGGDPNKAARAVDALLSEGVPAVIGAVGSDMTLLASQAFGEQAVLVSPSASAVSLGEAGPGVFRLCASDAAEGRLLAQRARDHADRPMRAAILRRAGGDEGLAQAFRAAFERADRKVVVERTYAPGQESYAGLLAEVFADGFAPDAVLLDAEPIDGAQIVRDFATGFAGKRALWLFPRSLNDEAFVTAAGPRTFALHHEGVGQSTPTGRRYSVFADAYAARFGAPPPLGSFAANAYDAVYLLALAIEAAGEESPAAIRARLGEVSLGGLAYGPEEFGDAVYQLGQGADVNYEGASGSVDLTAQGGSDAPFDVWTVQSGAITVTERAVRPPL